MKVEEVINELRLLRLEIIDSDNKLNALLIKNPEKWEIKKALKVWKRNRKSFKRRIIKLEREVKRKYWRNSQ